MKAFGYVCAFILTLIVSTILSGWALSVMWDWFIVPIFTLPSLTIPYAIGITLVIRFLTYENTENKTDNRDFSEKLLESIFKAILRPLVVVGLGWIVVLFI